MSGKYWYMRVHYYCPLCGETQITTSRKYTKKPAEYSKRNIYTQYICCRLEVAF